MSTRYFRAPTASYDAINVVLTTLIHSGDGTWLGPYGTIRPRPVVNGLAHWPQNFDPEATGSQIEKETFACHYVVGDLAPEYEPAEGVEEITLAEFEQAKLDCYGPEEI